MVAQGSAATKASKITPLQYVHVVLQQSRPRENQGTIKLKTWGRRRVHYSVRECVCRCHSGVAATAAFNPFSSWLPNYWTQEEAASVGVEWWKEKERGRGDRDCAF